MRFLVPSAPCNNENPFLGIQFLRIGTGIKVASLDTFPPSRFLTFVTVFSFHWPPKCFVWQALVGFTLQSFPLSYSPATSSVTCCPLVVVRSQFYLFPNRLQGFNPHENPLVVGCVSTAITTSMLSWSFASPGYSHSSLCITFVIAPLLCRAKNQKPLKWLVFGWHSDAVGVNIKMLPLVSQCHSECTVLVVWLVSLETADPHDVLGRSIEH